MTTPRNPSKLGPFTLGVNNRAAETDLDTREGSYLRAGVNVDLTAQGRLRRREGFSRVLEGVNMHSLFGAGKRSFVVNAGALSEIIPNASGITLRQIRGGLSPQARLSYCANGDTVIYTDGAELRVIEQTADRPLTVDTPNPAPTLRTEPYAGSTLPAGRYQLCAALEAHDGRFSGSTIPTQVELREGEALVVENMPLPPAHTKALHLYLTTADGTTFRHLATLTAPPPSITMATEPELGHVCPTFMMDALPAGDIVRRTYGGARLLSAKGRYLYYSEPYLLGLYNPLGGYVPFEDDITVVECSRGGIYVATESKTYRLPDDPSKSDLELLLPYGGVRGTGGTSPDRSVCWWMSTRGLVRAGAEGLRDNGNLSPTGGEPIVNLQEGAIAVGEHRSGASLFRERNGIKQVVSSLFGAETAGAAAYSYFDAEVIRKGTQL